MRIYWKEARRKLRLLLAEGEHEEEIGGIRQTKRGYDAFAKTFGYDPGRTQEDIPTLQEARAFVESFRPWELYVGGQEVTIEPDVEPQDS